MSDETTTNPTATDDALRHPPVEDYSGDDQQSAHSTVQQPSDADYPAAATQATDDSITDATTLPDDPSLGG